MDLMGRRRQLLKIGSTPPPVQNINIWDEEWETGAYSTGTGNKTVPSAGNTQLRSKNYIPVTPNTEYYIYIDSGYVAVRPLFYKADKTYLSSPSALRMSVLTTPADAYYMTFYTGSGYGTSYGNNISINYPSTDHEYHQHV